jgi:uncharacterized protein (DUF736 family)
MAIVGKFKRTKNGDWVGQIQTLMMKRNVRFSPVTREHSRKPDYHVFVGECKVGAAWSQPPKGRHSHGLLNARLEYPIWDSSQYVSLALCEGGKTAELFWLSRSRNRR